MPSPRCQPVLLALGLSLGLPMASAQRAELDGTWLQLSASRPQVGLTPAGQAAVADYVPLRDDPDLNCVPASLTNVIGIPDPPWEIRLHDDHVEINFEYMDVQRRVPLDPDLSLEAAPPTVADHPHLGRSVGRFDGDVLVIDTGDVGEGFVDTRGAAEGYPQSTGMRYEDGTVPGGRRPAICRNHAHRPRQLRRAIRHELRVPARRPGGARVRLSTGRRELRRPPLGGTTEGYRRTPFRRAGLRPPHARGGRT